MIARLGMRPHADAELIKQAKDAADAGREAIQLAAKALHNHRIGRTRRGGRGGRRGSRRGQARLYDGTRAYEALARKAVKQLIATET
ncbi:MAG: hypothetical protein WBP81_04995 [Solirubrobacteraceae bacterium]